jgi:hypothetical protein
MPPSGLRRPDRQNFGVGPSKTPRGLRRPGPGPPHAPRAGTNHPSRSLRDVPCSRSIWPTGQRPYPKGIQGIWILDVILGQYSQGLEMLPGPVLVLFGEVFAARLMLPAA